MKNLTQGNETHTTHQFCASPAPGKRVSAVHIHGVDTVLIAQFCGARDKARIKAVVDTTYIFLFAAGIGRTIVGVLAADPILRLMKAPPEVLGEASSYLKITFTGMLFMYA